MAAGCKIGPRVAKLQSTKLLQSVRRDDISRLETILRRGVPQLVNMLHPIYSNSPLIVAASEGNAALVDLLVQRGAASDLSDAQGRTAIMHAASQAHLDCVAKLIEFRASIDIEDHDSRGIERADHGWLGVLSPDSLLKICRRGQSMF